MESTNITRITNPILPLDVFVPDAEAHVWLEAGGRIYLYGSFDLPGEKKYCSDVYHVYSSDDLIHWTHHVARIDKLFPEHFGEVSSDQSWDFSKSNIQMVEESANARQTRALLNVTSFEAPIWKSPSLFDSNNQPDYYAHVYTDFEAVKQCAEDPTIRPIEWPYEYAEIKLHPFYGYGKKDVIFICIILKYRLFFIILHILINLMI